MTVRMVVDSSVVVKWFVRGEPASSGADRLYESFKEGRIEFIVPDLLLYEVGNVFLRKWRNEPHKIEETFVRLWHLPWFLMPLRKSLLLRTLQIASRFNVTFYDSLFVAAAEKADCPLITADRELVKKVRDFRFVTPLEDEQGSR